MISRCLHQLQMDSPAPKGGAKLMGSEAEARLVEFCLRRQPERDPVTTDDAIESMLEAGK
jgi:hypothetical protein